MSQTSDHQVIVQSDFHTENVKCLIKGKAIGSAGGHETSCLWVQGGPARKSRVILAGKRDVQEDTEKKSGRRGSQVSPEGLLLLSRNGQHVHDGGETRVARGIKTAHPTRGVTDGRERPGGTPRPSRGYPADRKP